MLGQSGGKRSDRRVYRVTRRNRQLLRKYRAGKSIGFTAKASLKAKGLIPRSDGRFILGPKYSKTGVPRVLKKSSATRRRR
jgi:hypothetical protein